MLQSFTLVQSIILLLCTYAQIYAFEIKKIIYEIKKIINL
jgi:hypothetical protein